MPSSTFRVRIFKTIALPFIVGSALVLLFIINISTSRAIITVDPKPEERLLDTSITINTSATPTPETIQGILFKKAITKTRNADAKKVRLEKGIARGTITIHNDAPVSQLLVATTRFLTPDGKLYRLEDRTVVPGRGTVDAEIYADQEGPEFNIEPTTFTVPGLSEARQKLVYGKTSSNITGGLAEIKQVTQEDIDREQELLRQEIEAEIADALKQEIRAPYGFWPEAIEYRQTGSSSNASAGDEVASFELSMTIEGILISARTEDITSHIAQTMKQASPEGYAPLSSEPRDVALEIVDFSPTSDNHQLNITFFITLARIYDDSFDKKILAGMNEEEVATYLGRVFQAENVEVELKPFWIDTIPRIPENIEIKLADPAS